MAVEGERKADEGVWLKAQLRKPASGKGMLLIKNKAKT